MSVKELRAQAGMTQKSFAEYFGISIKTVQNWEQGARECPDYLLSLMEYKLQHEGLIGQEGQAHHYKYNVCGHTGEVVLHGNHTEGDIIVAVVEDLREFEYEEMIE